MNSDPNAQDYNGRTPLYIAVKNNDLIMIKVTIINIKYLNLNF